MWLRRQYASGLGLKIDLFQIKLGDFSPKKGSAVTPRKRWGKEQNHMEMMGLGLRNMPKKIEVKGQALVAKALKNLTAITQKNKRSIRQKIWIRAH